VLCRVCVVCVCVCVVCVCVCVCVCVVCVCVCRMSVIGLRRRRQTVRLWYVLKQLEGVWSEPIGECTSHRHCKQVYTHTHTHTHTHTISSPICLYLSL